MSETPESQEWRPQETDPLKRLWGELRALKAYTKSAVNGILTNAGIRVEKDAINVERDLNVVGGGQVQVRDGGRLRVLHPSNDDAVYAGDIYSSDTGEYIGTGLLVEMPDGADILSARTGQSGRRVLYIRDNSGVAVVWIDDAAARGLSRPTFSIPMHNAYWQSWGSTDSSSWTVLAHGSAQLWSAGFYTRYRATSDGAGTSGQVRLVASHDGVDYVIGGPEAVGFTIAWHSESGAMPSQIPISGWVDFRLEARVTSGTGRVHAAVINLELGPA